MKKKKKSGREKDRLHTPKRKSTFLYAIQISLR